MATPQACRPRRGLSPRRHGDTPHVAMAIQRGGEPPPPRPEAFGGRAGSTGEWAEAEAAAAAAAAGVSFWAVTPGGSMADAGSQVLLGSGLTVLSQPLMYVKVLVQVRGRGPGNGELGRGNDTVARYRLQAACPRRRWGTSRCRPPWGGTSSGARSTSCPASSLTVSLPPFLFLPPLRPPPRGAGGVPVVSTPPPPALRVVMGPRCPQPSTS